MSALDDEDWESPTLEAARNNVGASLPEQYWGVSTLSRAQGDKLRESAMAGPVDGDVAQWRFDAINYAWWASIAAGSRRSLEILNRTVADNRRLLVMYEQLGVSQKYERDVQRLRRFETAVARTIERVAALPPERQIPADMSHMTPEERSVAIGRHYGYPICCCEDFAVRFHQWDGEDEGSEGDAREAARQRHGTTHIPCPQCIKEMDAGRPAYTTDADGNRVAIGSVARYLPRARHKRARKA